jgi:hypothetical protein
MREILYVLGKKTPKKFNMSSASSPVYENPVTLTRKLLEGKAGT